MFSNKWIGSLCLSTPSFATWNRLLY
jgi:hypothetical protein